MVGERVFSGRVPRVVGAPLVGILPFVDTYLLLLLPIALQITPVTCSIRYMQILGSAYYYHLPTT